MTQIMKATAMVVAKGYLVMDEASQSFHDTDAHIPHNIFEEFVDAMNVLDSLLQKLKEEKTDAS